MNTLDSLFEWVLAATLRASALAVVILGIQFMLRRRLPATWRHALWLPMLLVLIMPMLPQVPFGIMPQREKPEAVSMEIVQTSALPQIKPAVATPAENRQGLTPMAYAGLAWMAGAAAMLGMGVVGYRRNLERIKKASIRPAQDLAGILDEAAQEVGLRTVPQMLMSSAVESPAVTGLFRPLLLLPAGFPRGFSDAEAKLILLHEFTHVKRHDLPLNWLVCLLHSMHWFNPLLWFAFSRMREDRELACDAQVLSLGKTDQRSAYGHALLKLQLAAPASRLSLGFVGIFERSSNLRSRINDISTHRRSHPAWRTAGVILTGVLTLLGATEAQERKPKDPRQVAIEKKLDTIKIPMVSFKDSSLEEAVDFLRLRANEFDPAPKNQAERGVNFVIKAPKDFQAVPLTLNLKDVSLRKAIENVAEASGLAMTVDPFAVTLSPRTAAEKGAGKLKGKAMEMASHIVIQVVDFESVSLAEAVEFLNGKAVELAEEGKAPAIELSANANKEAPIKELRLRNVPLSEAVKYISEAAKEPLSANDEMIRFGK